jgi:hypothetical protein
MNKPKWLKVAMVVGAFSAAAVTALSAGTVPAILVGIAAATSTLGGLYSDKPRGKRPKPDTFIGGSLP